MDINRTRIENLKIIMGEFRTVSELAEKANTAASYLSQLKTGVKTAKGNTKKLGDDLARKLENASNKPKYWMDTNHSEKTVNETKAIYTPTNIPTVPLISWVQAGELNIIIDNLPPGIGEKQVPTGKQYSKSAFALKVNGDSMLDPHGNVSIQPGSIIIVDPEMQYENGHIVVAKFGDGEQTATLKKYVVDPPNKYLEALNPKYDPIKITEDCTIIGVATETINSLI